MAAERRSPWSRRHCCSGGETPVPGPWWQARVKR
jgi:hypothetical protein